MTKTSDLETNKRSLFRKEELYGQFSQAITSVKSYTNHFESEVARPTIESFFRLFEKRPILAIYLATLFGLSSFPILTFVIASGVVLVSFVTFALVVSFSAAFAVTAGFSFVLIFALIASAIGAAIIADICFSVYFAFRLFALLQQRGASEGLARWIAEIWDYFLAIGSMASYAVPFQSQGHSELVQRRQASEQSTEDSDSDRKVEGASGHL